MSPWALDEMIAETLIRWNGEIKHSTTVAQYNTIQRISSNPLKYKMWLPICLLSFVSVLSSLWNSSYTPFTRYNRLSNRLSNRQEVVSCKRGFKHYAEICVCVAATFIIDSLAWMQQTDMRQIPQPNPTRPIRCWTQPRPRLCLGDMIRLKENCITSTMLSVHSAAILHITYVKLS